MLWSQSVVYDNADFELESDLELALAEVANPLFGHNRIYVDVKRIIGKRGGTRNVPDGYLIDLSSRKEPKLYVVENELAKHEPLKHIAVQILEFSLSFETTPHKVKEILKEALQKSPNYLKTCQDYAVENGFENVDFLLERMIYPDNAFNALVVIDEISEELEKVLLSRFKFPVEITTLQRYVTKSGQYLYRFDPFLADVAGEGEPGGPPSIDPSEIDTIVVPARDEGFEEVFLGENRWYKIRIHSSMIPKVKYIASYRVAPISAITHIAEVESIQQWEDSPKYVVNFSGSAKKIKPIRLVPKGAIRAPQAPRYTSKARLDAAANLDEAF